MSFPASISSLDNDAKKQIIDNVKIVPTAPSLPHSLLGRLNHSAVATLTAPPSPPFLVLIIDPSKDLVKIPFGYARKIFGDDVVPGDPHPKLRLLSDGSKSEHLAMRPRDEQFDILERSKIILEASHGLILQAQPGAGKTFMSIVLASSFGLRTAILTPRETITKQWVKTIQMALPLAKIWLPQSSMIESKAKKSRKKGKKLGFVQIGTEPIDPETGQSSWDFAVMLVDRASALRSEILESVGMLIIDEVHMHCTHNRVKSILEFTPMYVISLSATIERSDGCHKMIHLITGDEKIVIEPKRLHLVIALQVPVVIPETKSEKTRLLNFTEFTNCLSECAEYNQAIVNLIAANSLKRKFIVLCSRVQHCKTLVRMLRSLEITSEEMCESKSSYIDCKVLVGTMSKVSVGFDAATCAINFDGVSPDTLIVATSFKMTKDYVQCAGRVMRASSDRLPIVIFFQTKNNVMQRHFSQMKPYIQSIGGHIIKQSSTSHHQDKSLLPESMPFSPLSKSFGSEPFKIQDDPHDFKHDGDPEDFDQYDDDDDESE